MSFASLFVVAAHASTDARTRVMAEALAVAGGRVDVLSMRDEGEVAMETIAGVRYIRLPVRRAAGSFYRRLFEELSFSVFAFVFASVLACRRRYDLFHSRGTPDLLVLCGILPRLLGAKVVIDLPEPAPETARSEHDLSRESWIVRTLAWMESFAIGCADVAIASSEAFRRTLIDRGADPERIRVMHDPIDPSFHPITAEEAGAMEGPVGRPYSFRIVCREPSPRPSAIETVLRAFSLLRREHPEIRLDILADPEVGRAHEPLGRALGLTGSVLWRGRRSRSEEAAFLRKADALLIVVARDPLDEKRLPRPLLEGLAVGLPVLAPRLPGLTSTLSEAEILYHEPEDPRDLARAVREAVTSPETAEKARDGGPAALARLRADAGPDLYLSLVQRLREEAPASSRRAEDAPAGKCP